MSIANQRVCLWLQELILWLITILYPKKEYKKRADVVELRGRQRQLESHTQPMFDILPEIKVTKMRQLSQIITAMLAMSGRVTMLGISRWTLSGGSYRTVIRFFRTVIPWAKASLVFYPTSENHVAPYF